MAEQAVTVPVTSQVNLAPGDVIDPVLHQNGSGPAVGAGLVVTVDVE
ncbi:MAG TPA: hypothetical protein VFP61_00945 [Acidimicrobiales bacterium]|nr:hypothetical protein [Acidimicrobiales bacterium]